MRWCSIIYFPTFLVRVHYVSKSLESSLCEICASSSYFPSRMLRYFITVKNQVAIDILSNKHSENICVLAFLRELSAFQYITEIVNIKFKS